MYVVVFVRNLDTQSVFLVYFTFLSLLSSVSSAARECRSQGVPTGFSETTQGCANITSTCSKLLQKARSHSEFDRKKYISKIEIMIL